MGRFSLLDLFDNLCHGCSLVTATRNDMNHERKSIVLYHTGTSVSALRASDSSSDDITHLALVARVSQHVPTNAPESIKSKQPLTAEIIIVPLIKGIPNQHSVNVGPILFAYLACLSEPVLMDASRSLESCLCSLCLLLPSFSLEDCRSKCLR